MGKIQRAEDILQQLIELYRRKHALLEEMLRITTEKNRVDEKDCPEEILRLIDDRQEYMQKVDAIDDEIKKCEKWHSEVLSFDAGQGNISTGQPDLSWEVIDTFRRTNLKLVGQIQELDRQQKRKLETELSYIKKIQEKLKVGRQTLIAYRNKTSIPESVFIDKKE